MRPPGGKDELNIAFMRKVCLSSIWSDKTHRNTVFSCGLQKAQKKFLFPAKSMVFLHDILKVKCTLFPQVSYILHFVHTS